MDEAQLSSAVAQLRQAANALRALTAARARSSSQQDEPAPKRQRSATPEAAPQPVVRFSRVQLSKVQFANEQLKDNSYAFKQSDFGTVANRVVQRVMQTKGKDFRKAKGKGKKATFSAGSLEAGTRSVRFSDAEDSD
eukprot:TRINITY_DN7663_c0_g1_i1.p1 TRINITY_DN7663_c0_g1~~TRINITY_DN7663_c0_g1_i1.p1  ORF type:complete len:147 (+),score=34.22 TRINITY_DN7663_c0_g1_i1:31-441(+)